MTLALRDAQDQNAALTAKNAELTTDLAAKDKELGELKAKSAATPAASEVQAQSDAQLKQAQDQLGQAQQVLAKWQAAYTKAAEVARARDGAANKAESDLKRTSAAYTQCTAKNTALEGVGNELLDRIENRTLWNYVSEQEPVTQIYRVRLENILQDYRDKLDDQEVVPLPPPVAVPKP